jgi:hypothetical protein
MKELDLVSLITSSRRANALTETLLSKAQNSLLEAKLCPLISPNQPSVDPPECAGLDWISPSTLDLSNSVTNGLIEGFVPDLYLGRAVEEQWPMSRMDRDGFGRRLKVAEKRGW